MRTVVFSIPAPRFWGLIAVLVLLTLGCRVGMEPQDREIRIGLLADLPTPGGRPMVNAAEMTVDEINAAGGIQVGEHKYRIRLIMEDTQDLPDTAVEAARKLIHQDHVLALVGPNISRNAIPVAEVAENTRIPMISPGSTHPRTTQNKKYVFRAAFVDPDQGRAMAQFAVYRLHVKRVVVLYEESSNGNRNVGESFQRHFEAMGGEVVHFLSYIKDDPLLTDQLQLIRESNPGAIYMPNYADQVIALAHTLRESGMDMPILGNDGWSPYKVENNPDLDGSYFTHHWHINAGVEPGVEAHFVDRYRRRFKWEPITMAALTKDAMDILFKALAACSKPDPDQLRDAIQNGPPHEGLTGVISFEDGGDPIKEPMILQIRKGNISVVSATSHKPAL